MFLALQDLQLFLCFETYFLQIIEPLMISSSTHDEQYNVSFAFTLNVSTSLLSCQRLLLFFKIYNCLQNLQLFLCPQTYLLGSPLHKDHVICVEFSLFVNHINSASKKRRNPISPLGWHSFYNYYVPTTHH